MNFMELAKKRFAVRQFSDEKVSEDLLKEILEAGMVAPTAKNNQSQRVYVLQSEEAIATLDQQTKCRYGAPTVLLVTYEESETWKNPLQEGSHSGVEDASIVATHMMLRAAELGVDSIWVNFFANTELERAFGLPESEHAVLLMPLGYRKENVKPLPTHEASKPMEEIVKYL